jgi:hypothetical protein
MTSDRVARIEGIVQVLILLCMGVMASAASFVHIHDVTVVHGQPSWIGWANAVVSQQPGDGTPVQACSVPGRRRAAGADRC